MKTKWLMLPAITLCLVQNATAIEVKQADSYRNNCIHTKEDFTISPEKRETSIYPGNIMKGNSGLKFIRDAESYIEVWQKEKGIIKTGTCTEWFRLSNVIPDNDVSVGVFKGPECIMSLPSIQEDEKADVQIVFHVAYKSEIGLDKGESQYYYYLAGQNKQIPIKSQQKRKWSEVKEMDTVCYDIYLYPKK